MPFNQWSLPKRRDYIRLLRASVPSTMKYPLKFQGQVQYLDVFIVDIEFPCYRLANGRTQAAQRELVAEEELPDNFFNIDPDSMPALEKQNDILRKMAKEAGLLDIFKKNPQDQPLILDNDGYIINGNRRLCVMKMLLEQDPAQYTHFRNIQVVILNQCSTRDIDELEALLQILPEGRAEYSWVDRAMMLRTRRDHGWSDDQLADLYNLRPVVIKTQITMLEDAEIYLVERNQKGHYSEVLKKEYAFKQLQKGRMKCVDNEAKKQLFTNISYLMIDDPDAAGQRLYESIPEALESIDEVANQIKLDFNDEFEKMLGSKTDDGLDLLGRDSQSGYSDVVTFIQKPENRVGVRKIIRDKLEEIRNEKEDEKDSTYCLRKIQKSYSLLQDAINAIDDKTNIDGIKTLLKNIDSVVSEINKIITNGNTPN